MYFFRIFKNTRKTQTPYLNICYYVITQSPLGTPQFCRNMSQASARAVHVNKDTHRDLKEATFVDDHDEDGGHDEVGGRLRRWSFMIKSVKLNEK